MSDNSFREDLKEIFKMAREEVKKWPNWARPIWLQDSVSEKEKSQQQQDETTAEERRKRFVDDVAAQVRHQPYWKRHMQLIEEALTAPPKDHINYNDLANWHGDQHSPPCSAGQGESYLPGLGTVRPCLDCGCLVPGGPTRCKRCAKEVPYEKFASFDVMKKTDALAAFKIPHDASPFQSTEKLAPLDVCHTLKWFIFIIDGEEFLVSINEGAALSAARERALKVSHNTGRTAAEWEIREETGTLLDPTRTIKDYQFSDNDGYVRLFLSLRAGVGG